MPLLMTSFFMLPVLLNLELGLIENVPGARILSSRLNVLVYEPRRLLVDTLLLSPLLKPPPSIEFPNVSGVLDVLDALPGVPYVLYENPNPRFCGVLKRDDEAGFILYIGITLLFFCLDILDRGVARGPGF